MKKKIKKTPVGHPLPKSIAVLLCKTLASHRKIK